LSAGSSTSGSTYLAFDTGPGNVLIDAAVRILTNGEHHFDKDGVYGQKGADQINSVIVDEFLGNEPYFDMHPPKTTGRELFSDDIARGLVEKMQSFGMSAEAIIATVTRITAESISRAYEQFIIPHLAEQGKGQLDEIYICGGGVYNPNILEHLQSRLPTSRVMKLDDAPAKLAPNAKEAVMFALLGYLSICGRTVPLPADAESVEPAIMGVITPGDNYREVMHRVMTETGFVKNGVLGRIHM
jgi:1,6-anhydro-N-acetylmuramate kinase